MGNPVLDFYLGSVFVKNTQGVEESEYLFRLKKTRGKCLIRAVRLPALTVEYTSLPELLPSAQLSPISEQIFTV